MKVINDIAKDEDSRKLLQQLLCWDPEKRLTAEKALQHRYINDGRLRYHSCMCNCCLRTQSGLQFNSTLEPISGFIYDDTDEKFSNIYYAKGRIRFLYKMGFFYSRVFDNFFFLLIFRIYSQMAHKHESKEFGASLH
jgi:hypothetical protein